MIPSNITEQNVLQAIQDTDSNGIRYPLTRSRKYDLAFNSKTYPPKYIVSVANEFANNEYLSYRVFSTYEAQKFLKGLSSKFIIEVLNEADPVLELLEKYKIHIRETNMADEIYKWRLLGQFKGRPDVNAPDFSEEIRSINFYNLIYPIGIAAIHHLAKERTEPYRDCFKVLFDETKTLLERVKYFNEETLKIYRQLVPEKKFSHHQDERTIATFLTYHDPDKYTFYKDSFYQKYCRLIGIKAKNTGEKYVHYLELINDLIIEYIKDDQELLDLVNSILIPEVFSDTGHKILAQDILYQTLDKQIGMKRSYWRIGTRTGSGTTSYWEEMKTNKMVCIGWSSIGDLNEKEINTKKDIEKLLADNDYFPGDNRTISRKAGEIFNFYTDIKVGDVILAQDGASVLGIGIIKDDYIYEGNSGFSHQRQIEWKITDLQLSNREGLNTTVYQLKEPNTIRTIDNMLADTTEEIKGTKMKNCLNQILFGPPGTGKTYNMVNKALELIGVKIEGKSRKEIKELFDKKMKEGQFVFTTFHQSMSYEDFIEGIKPVEPEKDGDSVPYRIEYGILRRLCIEASFAIAQLRENTTTEGVLDFSIFYDKFAEDVEEKLLNGKPVELDTKSGGTVMVESISSQGNFIIKHHEGTRTYTVSKARLSKLQAKIKDLDEVSNINNQFRDIIGGSNSSAYWSVLNAIKKEKHVEKPQKIERVYTFEDKKEVVQSLSNADYKNKTGKPFVLIIDEINRGNVSQIFGELITLIEEDKRLGNDEALEVTLPYSKEQFGVPPNLYIIGTMNTADRSVEALDTALRRRFSFVEKSPRYDLPELDYEYAGNKASKILLTINSRIEKLLDKDHTIGHSYFMVNENDKADEKLITSFYTSIIPLLQEYFFGDYGKIGLILGEGFIRKKEWNKNGSSFADFETGSDVDFEDKDVYEFIDYRNLIEPYRIKLRKKGENETEVEMNFQKAIKLLMKQDFEQK